MTQPTDRFEAVKIESYRDESQLVHINSLIEHDLSEPYIVYTYRFFLQNWPQLAFFAKIADEYVGVIMCKLEPHHSRSREQISRRGYIAMLSIRPDLRRRGIASSLVKEAITMMKAGQAQEIVLETEVTNEGAIALYERLGFLKDKRLHRYYLNGVDAWRLHLPLAPVTSGVL